MNKKNRGLMTQDSVKKPARKSAANAAGMALAGAAKPKRGARTATSKAKKKTMY